MLKHDAEFTSKVSYALASLSHCRLVTLQQQISGTLCTNVDGHQADWGSHTFAKFAAHQFHLNRLRPLRPGIARALSTTRDGRGRRRRVARAAQPESSDAGPPGHVDTVCKAGGGYWNPPTCNLRQPRPRDGPFTAQVDRPGLSAPSPGLVRCGGASRRQSHAGAEPYRGGATWSRFRPEEPARCNAKVALGNPGLSVGRSRSPEAPGDSSTNNRPDYEVAGRLKVLRDVVSNKDF